MRRNFGCDFVTCVTTCNKRERIPATSICMMLEKGTVINRVGEHVSIGLGNMYQTPLSRNFFVALWIVVGETGGLSDGE